MQYHLLGKKLSHAAPVHILSEDRVDLSDPFVLWSNFLKACK